MPSDEPTVQPLSEVIAIGLDQYQLMSCTAVPPSRKFRSSWSGKQLRFASKTGIPTIVLDRIPENPGCLESFLEDGLKNAGFFLSFMAKNEVRSATTRNTV